MTLPEVRWLLDALPDAVLVTESDGRIVMTNALAERLFGYRPDELAGRPVEDLMPERFRSEHVRHRARYAAELKTRPMGIGLELAALRSDGAEIPVEISLGSVRLGDRDLVVAAVRDVTVQRAAERALRLVVEATAPATGSDFFRSLVRCVAQALHVRYAHVGAVAGGEGEAVETLAVWSGGSHAENFSYRLAGTPCEHVVGKAICKHPSGLQKLFPADGMLRDLGAESYLGAPLFGSAGEPLGLIAVLDDRPMPESSAAEAILEIFASRAAAELERLRADDAVRRLNAGLEQRVAERTAELRALNQELEAFSYAVAHDLRAPLRAVDGFSEALLQDYQERLDTDGRDYLERIRAGAQRMAALIDDLLKLSRLSRAELSREQVDLSALARDLTRELKTREPERRVEVVVQEGIQARGDPRLLRVALEKLLENAWKFTAKRPHARVELGALEQEGETVYYVRDDGAGFDMTYADKLFAPFQRLHAAHDFPGSGIGLATVQRIVHRHGGRVWAEGTVNRGATFSFTVEGKAE